MADNLNTKPTTQGDTNVNLTIEQLSYICKYCGKVNAIDAPNCVRCGKRRPRNEYVNAMKRLGQSAASRQELLDGQARAEAESRDARQQQIVRMVEGRVEEERARILAQQEVRLDQDREEIKRASARDAVLRIIAAEAAADTRVAEAEARAQAAIDGKSQEIDDLLAAEREKALNAAAEKLVAERAAIEEAARERVDASRRASELDAARQIAEAKDEAERSAARQAVLRVIAYEQAAQDEIRLSREAYQQAATERIAEERTLADKEAAARYAAEKMAIERAAEERIRAEREAVQRILGDCGVAYGNVGYYGHQPAMNAPQTVQPIAIVPYLNQNQPVYQYSPQRVVYKFVPDAVQPQGAETEIQSVTTEGEALPVTKKQKRKGSVGGVLTLVLSLAVVAIMAVLGLVASNLNILNVTDGTVLEGTNTSILVSIVAFAIAGINSLFGSAIAVPEFLTGGNLGTFYTSANACGFAGVGVMSVAAVIITITALVLLVRSIIRIVKGNAKKSDWIGGLVMIIASVAMIVCHLLSAIMGAGMAVGEAVKTVLLTHFGNIAVLVLSVVITVIAGISGSKKEKAEDAE